MPGRSFNSNSYKYGFNGKENDPEVVGTGSGTQDYGLRIYNPALGRFFSVDPLSKTYPYKTTYDFAENDVIRSTDLDGAEKNINTLGLPVRSKYLGTPGQDFGFGSSNAPTAASNGGMLPGEPFGKKYYFNPNAMDGSSTSGHYFWQSPILKTTSTNDISTPPPNTASGNSNFTPNLNFAPNSPALTNMGQAQVAAIALRIQNTITRTTGDKTVDVQTSPIQNSEGLPGTVTTVKQSQPIQIVTVTSNVTISLSTTIPGAAGTALLTARFNTLRTTLMGQGIAGSNINMGTLTPGANPAGLTNGNRTDFNVQTSTTTQNGNEVKTTTTTKELTYGE